MKRPALFLLFLLSFTCGCQEKTPDPIQGEWEVESAENRRNKVKEIIRIDDRYFQQYIVGTDSTHDGASLTQVYTLSGDTLQTFDINRDKKKVYAWNCFFIKAKTGDQLKLLTLDQEMIVLNRIHSDFEKVDTTLDSKLK